MKLKWWMKMLKQARNAFHHTGTIRDAMRSGNVKVLMGLMPSAYRGFVRQVAKLTPQTVIRTSGDAQVDFRYTDGACKEEFQQLYEAAKRNQWNGSTYLDWSIEVDPVGTGRSVVPEDMFPAFDTPHWRKLDQRRKDEQLHSFVAWLLSQFLHGEQGALLAACQVTNSLGWVHGKLYGSTQVVDEGRHVEVFHRYLDEKLGKLYDINDNLYVILDALMADGRWDVKFLCMQIMIEGLALGAFGNMRRYSEEPLLRALLRAVIKDEARHVHFGVVALRHHYSTALSERELRDREDLAYELALLMRNRFLFHELYDEYYAPLMTRKEWERTVFEGKTIQTFIDAMFKRVIPNLKAIGLLSDRIRPHYEALGLLRYEHEKAAPDLQPDELLVEGDPVD